MVTKIVRCDGGFVHPGRGFLPSNYLYSLACFDSTCVADEQELLAQVAIRGGDGALYIDSGRMIGVCAFRPDIK